MTTVDFETARGARGLRVISVENVPSPWSQGALGLFDLKGLDYVVVPFRKFARAVRDQTGANNAPVVLWDDESPRTGWAEILALAERLGGRMSLVPDDEDRAITMYGLAHAILSEGGLGWSVRLLLTHVGLTTDGREGWPAVVAAYLAPKYGYTPERVPAARPRAIGVLRLLERTLARSEASGQAYLLGAVPTALDVYAATALGVICPLPPDTCPIPTAVRPALETLDPQVRRAVSPSLLRHRDLMYERYLRVPFCGCEARRSELANCPSIVRVDDAQPTATPTLPKEAGRLTSNRRRSFSRRPDDGRVGKRVRFKHSSSDGLDVTRPAKNDGS